VPGPYEPQVLRSVKSLAYHAKVASTSLCDQATPSKRVAAVSSRPIDVLVSTPGRLLEMLQSRSHPTPREQARSAGHQTQRRPAPGRQPKAEPTLHLSDLRFLVFDEADVLFDDEFGPMLLPMLRRLLRKRDQWEPSSQPAQLQCILAGASWPAVVQSDRERQRGPDNSSGRKLPGRESPLLRELLRNELSDAVRAQSGGLHRLPAGARQHFAIRVPPESPRVVRVLSERMPLTKTLRARQPCVRGTELDLSFRLVTNGQGKPDALIDTLRQLRPGSAVMVFTNTTKAAVYVTAMLREQVT
jgi:hypothetical protein